MSLDRPKNRSYTPHREEGLDGNFKQYNPSGLLEKSSYGDHVLDSLKHDPELDISKKDGDVLREYFERQSPKYVRKLNELVHDAPKFFETTKVSIAIPAYKEGANIYKTLECYSGLKQHKEFEIVILENHTQNVARDNTAEEVGRFQREHPDMQITHLYNVFDQKQIGYVRKMLTDSVLLRKQQAGREDSILIASNDADLEGINPQYVKLLTKAFESDARLDVVRGGTDHSTESFAQFPLMHATIRFLNYFRLEAQRLMPNPLKTLVGRNSVYRSGIYAAVGGYNERALVGEDIEIGRLIAFGRRGREGHVRYFASAWIETNARREIGSVLAGTPLVRRYEGFVENENIYDIPLDELIREGKDFSPEHFKIELQAVYDFYRGRRTSEGGWLPDIAFGAAYDRSMRFLGIKYHLDGDKVVVDDLSKLMKDLQKYRERHAS